MPSLRGGAYLIACLRSLDRQTERSVEIVVVDNTDTGAIERELCGLRLDVPLTVCAPRRNMGFAAAVNHAWSRTQAPLLATLNDDAEAHPEWLAELKHALAHSGDIGMCASQVRIHGSDRLDSAGMLISLDGSSKQRGQNQPARAFAAAEDVLLPSASAALYRRAMLEDIGGFDEDFFLYCEDTDLGLRARWNGWRCVYVPRAIVEHRYSKSAGGASTLKASQVERNRLWVALKNFPPAMLLAVPFWTGVRYLWHVWAVLRGHGTAGEFRSQGATVGQMARIVFLAHWSALTNLGALLRKRRAIRKSALLSPRQYRRLLMRHLISPREIARL